MKSIRLQMLLFIVLLILFQFIFLGYITDKKLNELPSYVNSQYEEIVAARSSEVSRELIVLIEQVETISKLPFVKAMDFEAINDNLSDIVNTRKHRNITISNLDGWAWTSIGMEIDISEQEQYHAIIKGQGESLISQPFISPYVFEQKPIITISHSVKDNNETVGLVNIVVYIDFLNDIVRKINVDKSEVGWIVDKHGAVIAHLDASIPMDKHINEIINADKDSLKRIIDKPLGSIQHYDEDGESLLTMYKNIEASPDWTFMITFYEKDIYSEILGIRKSILYTLIISILVVGVITVFYSSMILRPILKLKETFQKATNGDLYVKANENIPNELGEAGKSFNSMMEKIRGLMFEDAITGLYNYEGCLLELPHKLTTLKQKNGVVGLAIISLDDFKRINSIGGYAAGNFVLKEIATRLSGFINHDEGIARYFGDEFILLMWAESESALGNRISDICNSHLKNVSVYNYEFLIRMSIGVSIIDKDCEVQESIKQATIAKFKVKELGGNSYLFYNERLDGEIRMSQEIENALNHALEKNELYIAYQPIVDIHTRQIVAVEALLRWNNEKYNNISTLQIIKIAEQTGLILDIGEWVLREACKQNKEWQDQGYSPFVISINISAIQLEDKKFTEKVRQIVEDSRLDATYLELEITETNAMFNIDYNLQTIKKLKELGIRIAIDDFGTGYSSLSYLAKFPIDTLKIDRAFVNEIKANNHSKTIVDTILSMAQTINVSTIAEGVETEEQLNYLKEKDCNYVQGYLISKPVSAEAIEQILKDYIDS